MIGSKFGSFVSLTHVKCPGKLTLIYLLHERTGARQTSSATGEEKQRYKIKLTCIRIRTELKTKEKYHSVGVEFAANVSRNVFNSPHGKVYTAAKMVTSDTIDVRVAHSALFKTCGSIRATPTRQQYRETAVPIVKKLPSDALAVTIEGGIKEMPEDGG